MWNLIFIVFVSLILSAGLTLIFSLRLAFPGTSKVEMFGFMFVFFFVSGLIADAVIQFLTRVLP